MTSETGNSPIKIRARDYNWRELKNIIFSHRKELWLANLIAILGAVVAVPIPLLMPLLVDEVLLDQPGTIVAINQWLFPQGWHSPVLYITAVLVLTLILRLIALVLGVWQMRQFTFISKDVIFSMRRDLLAASAAGSHV